MLTVLTDKIIDQNHFGNLIRTSLSNSTTVSAQSEMINFAMKKSIPRLIVQGKNLNFKRILKCSRF